MLKYLENSIHFKKFSPRGGELTRSRNGSTDERNKICISRKDTELTIATNEDCSNSTGENFDFFIPEQNTGIPH
jgi:hypothetical protein